MNKITIKTDTAESNIFIGEKLKNLSSYIPENKVVIITDQNIIKHYKDLIPDLPTVIIGQGEKIKTLDTINMIFEKFLKFEVDRSWYVLVIGGGIVCDIAGFAASIYMRGLNFGFVSTTLLSQVDASVGGKNGVNFKGYKNMVGVFNQPEFVMCDLNMLKTLERMEFLSGFAEIVKAAVIKNNNLFTYLENNYKKALDYNIDVLKKIVYESVFIKSEVVKKDEKEKGERRKLNFGHTFAHSFEKHLGITHGQAVSIGMVLAASLSQKYGLIEESDVTRIKNLLINLSLPVKTDFNSNKILSGIKKDKKREGEHIHLVLLNKIGNAVIRKVTIQELEKNINDLYSNF
jgi:3-dehydroquinate synthase